MNCLKNLFFLSIAALSSFSSYAQCSPPVPHDTLRLIPNNSITASAQHGNILYIAGDFNVVGRYTGPFIGVDINTGKPVYNSWPIVRGKVNRILPDGNGGWYVGGLFRKIGDSARNGFAHIDASGTVSPLNANLSLNHYVNDMLIKDSILYIAGVFNIFMGDSVSGLAAINLNTGLLASWQPRSNGEVFTMAENNGLIYLGGSFTNIDTSQRSRLAAVDAITGQLTTWNPNVGSNNPRVNSIVIVNNKIFVGGYFASISNIPRDGLAELSPVSGVPTNWNPPLGGHISKIIPRNGSIYVSGTIDTSQSYGRPMLLKIDTALTADIDTIINFDLGGLGTFCIEGDTIYASGFFHYLQGKRRISLLAWSITGDSVTSWECNPGGETKDIYVQNGRIYLAGDFYNVGKVTKGLAAIDMSADTVLNWFPSVGSKYNGTHKIVRQLLLDGNKLYIAGQFDSVNSQRRRSLAAIDRITGDLLPWRPRLSGNNIYNIDSSVNEIALSGNSIYLGGRFNKVNNVVREGLAAVDTATGLTTRPWNPHTYSQAQNVNISAVYAHDTFIYVGGAFYDIANTQRNNIVKLGRISGAADPNWHPDILSNFYTSVYAGVVREIQVNDGYLYVAGHFQSVDSQQRNGLAKLRLSDGAVMPWQGDQFNNLVSWSTFQPRIHFIGNSLYLTRDSLTIIDKVSGTHGFTSSFGTNSNRTFYTANSYNGKLYIGGYFTNLTTPLVNTSEVPMHHLLYFNIGIPPSTTVYAPNPVCENTNTTFAVVTQATNPTYQWQVNDTNVNATGIQFNYVPQQGDVVSCIVSDTLSSCYFSPEVSAGMQMIVVPPNTTPTVTLSGPDTVCFGNHATYFTNTNVYGGTYQWLVNGINSGANTNQYTFFPQNNDSVQCVITTPPLNCFTTSVAYSPVKDIIVDTTIIPSISIATSDFTSSGDLVWLHANVSNTPYGYTIHWLINGVGYTYTTGSYTAYTKGPGRDTIVAVVIPNGLCFETDTSEFIVNYNTSVASGGNTANIYVYPNPFDSELMVSDISNGDYINLYDLSGRLAKQWLADQSKMTLNVKDLPSGTYLLRITTKEGTVRMTQLLQRAGD